MNLKISPLETGKPPVQHMESNKCDRNQSPPPKYVSRSPSVNDNYKATGESRPNLVDDHEIAFDLQKF